MLEKIGKYEVSEQIGVGGFGAVYKGRDPFIKRTVAIKTCQVNDEEIKHRFFREAELAGNLHHRHITTIYDFGVENGIPYIVQEFLTGEDLDKKIKRGDPISMARKVEILMAIADGLGYAHNASIVHRDVKPANVRVLDDGTVKVMDFGIAKSLQSESNLTQTGITLGTSAYLAPEQIRGEPIDRRTDIFALGVLSYELLTYRKPFRGEHLSTVLYKILNDTPEPIGSLVQDAPPALIAAVGRAMAKAPADRYATMEAFRKDLQAVYRTLNGATSGLYPAVDGDTVRAVRSEEDMETTLATPSSGVSPIHAGITPPSGALARVPAPSDRTPTSQSLSGARPPLELVNFRDPLADPANEETVRRSTDAPKGPAPAPAAAAKSRSSTIVAILAVLVAGVAAYMYVSGRNAPAPAAPPPALPTPAPAAVPTAALEFPEPKLGAGETSTSSATSAAPVPAPPAPAAAAPEAAPTVPAPSEAKPEPPAAPASFKVQFSSVPVATLFVDGRKVGASIPAKTISLPAGDHTVRMEAAGFPPYEKKFKVGAGAENRVHYQFPVSMLVIQATGWAGARVLVDGKYQGTLPDASRLKLSPGTYNVTLSREGSNPITERIEIPEGSPKTWNAPPPSPAASGGP
jgi:eukaryotic-like serine/threonine-protein kinase